MNRKQFFTLLVLAIIIGGLGIYFYNRNKESYSSGSGPGQDRVIKGFPLNDIAHLRIKGATNEVNLARGADNIWTVRERYNYPANYSQISEFLRKVWELKPVQDVQVGSSQLGRLNLVDPTQAKGGTNTALVVEFKDAKGSTLKTLLLGKNVVKESQGGPMGGGGEFPVGRYVMTPGTPSKVWLVSETFSSIQTKPEEWLSKDFFKVEKPKSVSVSYQAETNSWSIAREKEGGDWKMADVKPGENFDASKASGLNYALSSPSFNDVVSPEASADQTGMAKPTVIKIQTFDGFTYTINAGGKTNDDYYMKVSVEGNFAKERAPGKDEKAEDKQKLDKEFKDKTEKLEEKLKNERKFSKWTYLVSKWTLDSVLKDRKDFLSEKKDEKKGENKEEKPASAASTNVSPVEALPPELKNLPPALPSPAEKKSVAKPESASSKPENRPDSTK